MKVEYARKSVIKSFDIFEALKLIEKESKKGKLECYFRKGDCITTPIALDYMNGLKALGYHVMPYGPYLIEISWDPSFKEE